MDTKLYLWYKNCIVGEFEESEADLDPKRMSSGLGESIESNPELDALSRMVVDKVLERISKTGAIQQPPPPPQSNTAMAVSKVACDDKSSLAVTQMRHLLQRERNLVSELQVSYKSPIQFVFRYFHCLYFRLLLIQRDWKLWNGWKDIIEKKNVWGNFR